MTPTWNNVLNGHYNTKLANHQLLTDEKILPNGEIKKYKIKDSDISMFVRAS